MHCQRSFHLQISTRRSSSLAERFATRGFAVRPSCKITVVCSSELRAEISNAAEIPQTISVQITRPWFVVSFLHRYTPYYEIFLTVVGEEFGRLVWMFGCFHPLQSSPRL